MNADRKILRWLFYLVNNQTCGFLYGKSKVKEKISGN